MEFHPFSSPSTPLRLHGFLTGDTVQVHGDTGHLQFSVQFNIHRKDNPSPSIPDESSAAYLTPTPSHESKFVDYNANAAILNSFDAYAENQDENGETFSIIENNVETSRRSEVVTRLRSGALTPLKYSDSSARLCHRSPNATMARTKRRSRSGNALDKMLKRRSLP